MASETAPASGLPPSDRHRPFGGDTFGIQAERFARFFGTPTFILGQSGLVILWIVLNALAITQTIAWDRPAGRATVRRLRPGRAPSGGAIARRLR